MSAITQSTGSRSVLASLQNTAEKLGATQNRLATGKRVNSALDNPIAYFTSQSLNNHASGLNALLDNIGLAQNALREASQGLASLIDLTESAKSIAAQARRTPPPLTNYAQIDQIGAADASAEAAGVVTGSVDVSPGGFAAVVNGLQVQVGATTYTVHSSPAAEGINAIVADINNTVGLGSYGAVTASLDATGRFIELTANDTETSFDVPATSAAAALGIAGQTGTSTDLLQAVPGLSGTSLTVQANGGAAKTITFGNGGAQVSTFSGLQNALLGTGVAVTLAQNGSAKNVAISVGARVGTQNTLSTSGSALGALGISGGVELGIATTPVSNRVALQTQYNALLRQIDSLARDSSFNGINLLQGNNLNVQFNESGGSAFLVSGGTYDAAGLGLSTLSGTQFQSNTGIDVVTAALNAAVAMMRTASLTFGSGLSTLTIRQDFMKGSVNILQTGADSLTLADTNQEGANLLALQTRQSLSSTALALSAQSDQAVLKLFQ